MSVGTKGNIGVNRKVAATYRDACLFHVGNFHREINVIFCSV